MHDAKVKNPRPAGFTIIVLLVAVALFILFTVYAMTRTMKQVNINLESDDQLKNTVPAPTIQNYQQTLDSVRENVNESIEKQQQKLDDAQKEMNQAAQ